MAVSPAVFLDKDGTLVENVPYNADPALMVLVDGALPALRLLQGAGYRLVVVSNQSGVAKGLFPEEALTAVEARLRVDLADGGVALAGFYYCPHDPSAPLPAYRRTCMCRKPRPGLLLRASADLDIDLGRSWMLGDILDDVEAGRRAGCRTILVDRGNEDEWRTGRRRTPHLVTPDLARAAEAILARDPERVA